MPGSGQRPHGTLGKTLPPLAFSTITDNWRQVPPGYSVMIHPALPPACYTEQSWLDREREHIFGRLWLFAGLTQQLQASNSFITRDLNGIPVLIQNLDGELHAFRNACAHRGMPIQTQECGNRKLICPYHGWSYHNDGRLRGVPNEKLYNLCDRNQLKLQTYAHACIGNFIFVNLSPDPLPIEEQLSSDLRKCLTEISAHFSDTVSYTHFTGHYNWKLNFENILDWNHVQFVHGKTFAPLVAYGNNGAVATPETSDSSIFAADGSLADVRFQTQVNTQGQVQLTDISWISRVKMPYQPRWFSGLFESAFDKGALFGSHIFPNLNLGCLHGESLYLQQYVPVAPDRTEFHSWVFTSRLKPDVPPQPHLLWGIHHAEKRVIDEDRTLLKALQHALASATTTGVMGDYEHRQHTMGRWYMQHVGEDCA